MSRAAALLLLAASAARADDWPQFRGPGGRGVSDATGLPVKWSEDEGLRWKVALPGRGLSSPIVAGGRLYVTACTGPFQERLHVLAFDPATGKRLWERELRATGPTQCNRKTCMAAPTPAAAPDGRVFALFATCDLAAFDRDGNLLWYRALARDYPTIGNNVGIAASPVLHEGVLLVPMENVGDSFAAAIDAGDGSNLWKRPRARRIAYTTPFVARRNGRAEAIFQSPSELTAYEPRSGSVLWSSKGKFSGIPSPVAADGLVFAPGGRLSALEPGDAGVRAAWASGRLQSPRASPTLYRGRLYAVNNAGVLTCADPETGELLWRERTEGPYWASPVAADGKLFLVNEKGTTTVIALGDAPEILATNALDDTFLASPAVSGDAIYLRSDGFLYCIGRAD